MSKGLWSPPSLSRCYSVPSSHLWPLEDRAEITVSNRVENSRGPLGPWPLLVRVMQGLLRRGSPLSYPLRTPPCPGVARFKLPSPTPAASRQLLPREETPLLSPSWPNCQPAWSVPLSYHMKGTRAWLRLKSIFIYLLLGTNERPVSVWIAVISHHGERDQTQHSLSEKGQGFKTVSVTRFVLIL